jgi:hypothetical protein
MPSTTAPAAPGPATPGWNEAGELTGATEFGTWTMVGFDQGYVAVGSRSGNERPTAWFSADARSWVRQRLPSPRPVDDHWPGTAAAAATDGRTVVIVGGYAHGPCGRGGDQGAGPRCPLSPISWVSDDGLTWRSSMPWVGPVRNDEGFDQGSEFSEVWAVPDGWEASLFYWQGEARNQREIWHSTDGLAWKREAVAFAEGEHDFTRHALANADGRRILAANLFDCPNSGDCRHWVRLWTSDDGTAWADLVPPDAATSVAGGLAPGVVHAAWLLAGTSNDEPAGLGHPALWASDDLATWRPLRLPGAAALEFAEAAVAPSVDGLVTVAWGAPDEPEVRATWWSADGLEWTAIPDAPFIRSVAGGPAGVLGLGVADQGGTVPAYLLE